MTRPRPSVGIALCVAVLLNASAAGAQTAPPSQVPPGQTAPPSQPTPPTPPPPDNLDRIRRGLSHESAIRLDNGQLKIYVEVIAKWPSFAEMTKGYDFMNGPTGWGNPMSHQEFLNMMTPKEMYGSGGISAPEVLTMALVNYFGKKAIEKGIKEIGQTRDQKKIAEIRARIDAELAALRGGL
jgi:hypothetical protein